MNKMMNKKNNKINKKFNRVNKMMNKLNKFNKIKIINNNTNNREAY